MISKPGDVVGSTLEGNSLGNINAGLVPNGREHWGQAMQACSILNGCTVLNDRNVIYDQND